VQVAEPPSRGPSYDAAKKELRVDGVVVQPGDFLYLEPCTFDQLEAATADLGAVPDYAAKGRFHKVRCALRLSGCRVLWGSAPLPNT
jgi:hypothetical protein